MNDRLKSFVDSLGSLADPANDDYLESKLYAMVAPVEDVQPIDELVVPIFQFFELYPDADFGTPGPLVHLIEKHPGSYEAELEASLLRKPCPHPVWMLNRLLNSDLSDVDRQRWISLMRSILHHPEATESAKDNTERFLEYQALAKS